MLEVDGNGMSPVRLMLNVDGNGKLEQFSSDPGILLQANMVMVNPSPPPRPARLARLARLPPLPFARPRPPI